MSYRSAGLRTFGLCLVVALGLFSIVAAAAQAGPDWLRKNPGPPVVDELLPGAANFIVTADVTLAIETTVAGLAVKISCEKTEMDSGNLEEEGKASGTYLFNGCSTFIKGVLSTSCKPTG
jgi:hypothetical protein